MGRVTFLVLCACLAVACASAPSQTALMEQANIGVSTTELRVQVRALARPFGGLLENSVDEILAHAKDPELRANALRWKISAVPALHSALFEPDPLAALVDTAVLLDQMEMFLTGEAGAEIPPPALELSLRAIAEMHGRLDDVVASVGATENQVVAFERGIHKWATENPITWSIGERKSTHPIFAKIVANDKTGLGAAAGRLEESLADISARIDLYAEVMAKQARWQAELAFEDALARGVPRQLIDETGPLPIEVRDLPVDLPAERQAILDALTAERELILQWIRGERLETLDFVDRERILVLEQISAELASTITTLQAERELLLVAVAGERIAATRDAERLLKNAMQDIQKTLLDHLLNRLVGFVAVVLPILFGGLFFLVWFATRRLSTR